MTKSVRQKSEELFFNRMLEKIRNPEPPMYKGMVFKSCYTPGLANATDVHLSIGDRIVHQGAAGLTEATVQSGYSRHTNGRYGYECLFDDTGMLQFAAEEAIVDWPGKPKP